MIFLEVVSGCTRFIFVWNNFNQIFADVPHVQSQSHAERHPENTHHHSEHLDCPLDWTRESVRRRSPTSPRGEERIPAERDCFWQQQWLSGWVQNEWKFVGHGGTKQAASRIVKSANDTRSINSLNCKLAPPVSVAITKFHSVWRSYGWGGGEPSSNRSDAPARHGPALIARIPKPTSAQARLPESHETDWWRLWL